GSGSGAGTGGAGGAGGYAWGGDTIAIPVAGDGIGGAANGGNGGTGGAGGIITNGDGGNGGAGGTWGAYNGDDSYVNGLSQAQADAIVDTSEFNQEIVMGANLLGNTIDMTV